MYGRVFVLYTTQNKTSVVQDIVSRMDYYISFWLPCLLEGTAFDDITHSDYLGLTKLAGLKDKINTYFI